MDTIDLFDVFRNKNDLCAKELDTIRRHCEYLVECMQLEESLDKGSKGIDFKILKNNPIDF